MVPEMNKTKPYLSRTGKLHESVHIFLKSNLGSCFDLHQNVLVSSRDAMNLCDIWQTY